jgi:hypothetical protein
MGRQKTIKISTEEYHRLIRAKKKLEQDLGADLAFGSAIALLAGVFLGAIASKNNQYLACRCNNIIDVTGLPDKFSCRKCGLAYTRTDRKGNAH